MNKSGQINASLRTHLRAVDVAGVSVSSLCLIHCLALPVLAGILPIAGVWAESEWIHKAFVLLAIPISGYAVFTRGVQFHDSLFVFLVTFGLALLAASAFINALHDFEKPVTGAGAFIIAAAHIWRWRRHTEASRMES